MSTIKAKLRQLFRTPEDVDIRSHLTYFFWQRIIGINRGVSWPVHFTSRVVAPENITRGIASYPGDMPGCYIQANNGIEIGDYCLFGPNVGLVSANHDPENPRVHVREKPIKLGDHCWIGMNAVILPGVVLGHRTTVGAGAVVTESFPDGYCVLAGNPARMIRKIEIPV